MNINFTISTSNLEKLKEWKITNFREVFKQWNVNFSRGMAGLFNNKGRLTAKEGPSWAPLEPKYKERKKKFTSGGTLVFTGKLADSFRQEKGSEHIYNEYDFFAEFGSRNRLARYHQEGTRNIPARPIIFNSVSRNKAFKRILSEYIYMRLRMIGINLKEEKISVKEETYEL